MSNPEQQSIERRKSFRIDMEDEAVDVFWRDNEGQSHQVKSVCVDFSKGGMRIEHSFAILPNTVVSFRFQAQHPHSQELKAAVVRCNLLSNGKYSIGLQMI